MMLLPLFTEVGINDCLDCEEAMLESQSHELSRNSLLLNQDCLSCVRSLAEKPTWWKAAV